MVEKRDGDDNDENRAVTRSNMLSPEEGEKSDRMGFIRKVYGILAGQLSLTALAITAVQLSPEAAAMVQGHSYLALGLFLTSVVI